MRQKQNTKVLVGTFVRSDIPGADLNCAQASHKVGVAPTVESLEFRVLGEGFRVWVWGRGLLLGTLDNQTNDRFVIESVRGAVGFKVLAYVLREHSMCIYIYVYIYKIYNCTRSLAMYYTYQSMICTHTEHTAQDIQKGNSCMHYHKHARYI